MRTHSKNQNKGRSFVLGLALAFAMGGTGCGGKDDPTSPYEVDFNLPASLAQYDGDVEFDVSLSDNKDAPGSWICRYEAKSMTRASSTTACYFHPKDDATFPLRGTTVFLVGIHAHGPGPCSKFGMVGQTCEGTLSPSEYPAIWVTPSYAQAQPGIRIVQAYYDKLGPILSRNGGSFLTVNWTIQEPVAPAAPTP